MVRAIKTIGSELLLFLGGLFLFSVVGSGEGFGAAASELTRTHSGGGVTVKVTYLNSQATGDVRFQLVLDTHSVNLDVYDLNALSVLRDEIGKSYGPTQVENKGDGHHREITLIFPKSSADAKRLELVIKDIAGVKERSFHWNLE